MTEEVDDGNRATRAGRAARIDPDKDSYRSVFRYGSFTRNIPLPAGCSETDVTATYRDGVLEIRVPTTEEQPTEPGKIPVARG